VNGEGEKHIVQQIEKQRMDTEMEKGETERKNGEVRKQKRME
jgi:hypothetical protein